MLKTANYREASNNREDNALSLPPRVCAAWSEWIIHQRWNDGEILCLRVFTVTVDENKSLFTVYSMKAKRTRPQQYVTQIVCVICSQSWTESGVGFALFVTHSKSNAHIITGRLNIKLFGIRPCQKHSNWNMMYTCGIRNKIQVIVDFLDAWNSWREEPGKKVRK